MEKINFNDLPSTDTPINSSNLNQLQTNVENEINVVNKKFNYSTSEQRIGTWIDGKDLFRRVYNCGKLTNAGTTTVSTGLSNVNYIDMSGVAIYIGVGSTGWPYKMSTGSSPTVVGVDILEDKIRVQAVADLSAYTGYVTILYTKNN